RTPMRSPVGSWCRPSSSSSSTSWPTCCTRSSIRGSGSHEHDIDAGGNPVTTQPSEVQLVVPGAPSPGGADEFGGPSLSQGRRALRTYLHSPLSVLSLLGF